MGTWESDQHPREDGGRFANATSAEQDSQLGEWAGDEASANEHVTIDDPDDPTGMPAYDGLAGDAGRLLEPGSYPASTDDGRDVRVTVRDQRQPAPMTDGAQEHPRVWTATMDSGETLEAVARTASQATAEINESLYERGYSDADFPNFTIAQRQSPTDG